MLAPYAEATKVNALGLDYSHPPAFVDKRCRRRLPCRATSIRCGSSPAATQMDTAARDIIAAFADRPHIFNLGHGIVPETPIEHVERLIRRGQGESRRWNGSRRCT